MGDSMTFLRRNLVGYIARNILAMIRLLPAKGIEVRSVLIRSIRRINIKVMHSKCHERKEKKKECPA